MVDVPKPGPAGSQTRPPRGAAHRTVFSLSEEETVELGRSFSRHFKGGELVVLEGQLGLGKTVFARGVAAGLEIPPEDVSSPSYALVHEYRGGRVPMFHIDLYRLEEAEDMASLGLDELLTAGAVVVAEWGDRLPPYYRRDALTVRFHDAGEGSRRIELLPATQASAAPRSNA